MSSSTRYTTTPVTPPTFRVTTTHGLSGVEVLDLMPMLGDDGTRLVKETLGSPRSGWERVEVDGAARSVVFQRGVRDGMPPGVSALVVEMRLADGVAEVTNRWTYQTTEVRRTTDAARVPAVVTAAVKRLVGQAVNQVVMHTIANQIQQRMQQAVRQKQVIGLQQTLFTQMLNANQVQVRVRQRAGV